MQKKGACDIPISISQKKRMNNIIKIEKVNLSGADWFIFNDDYSKDDFICASREIDKEGMIPGRVPGNIQSDLENAHELTPIWYGTGDPELEKVAQKNWWYRKDFILTENMKNQRIKLYFNGVDYSCEVWLNNIKIARNEGMFKRFDIDITDFVNLDMPNRLAVKIDKIPDEIVPYISGADGKQSGVGTEYYFVDAMNRTRQVIKGLKAVANFSYDWGVNIWTLGIWKDVYIETSGCSKIEWSQIQTAFSNDFSKVELNVGLEIDSIKMENLVVDIKVFHESKIVTVNSFDVNLESGTNKVQSKFIIDNPKLWWPNNYGGQPLYDIRFELKDKNRNIVDYKKERFGMREIKWEQVEGADANFCNPYRLIINGVPIRMMGSNLISPDLLYGRIGKKGRYVIKMAKEANMNTLRQHGGQVIFDEDLYNAADELGIMIILEYPMANSLPEDEHIFLKNLEDTLRSIVKQLRNHSCIIEWSGGNEMLWSTLNSEYPALMVEKNVTTEEDDRLFRATCPIEGSTHSPWDYNPDLHYKHYNSNIKDTMGINDMMRYGEFGCQSPSNIEVWHREIPPSSQWPIDVEDPVLIRKNVVNAVFRDDYWLVKKVIDRYFGESNNLENIIKAGQFIGAEGLRYAMDALRAKGKKVGGFTSWDFNEPWPNGAGSYLVDYDGRPVMMYYFAKQALEPITLQLKYESMLYSIYSGLNIELLLVSDLNKDLQKLRWKVICRDRRGDIFNQITGTANDVNYLDVIKLSEFDIKTPIKTLDGPVFVELYLFNNDNTVICERIYIFGASEMSAPLGKIIDCELGDRDFHGLHIDLTGRCGGYVEKTKIEVIESKYVSDEKTESLKIILENSGSMTALFCEFHPLLEYRTDISVDNNFLFIPPNEKRIVNIRANKREETELNLDQIGWKIDCWNSDSVYILPSKDIIMFSGRKDVMCQEYSKDLTKNTIQSNKPYSEFKSNEISYLVEKRQKYSFFIENIEGNKALLRIHTCDQSDDTNTLVRVKINEFEIEKTLQKGLGIQKKDMYHLAYPQTMEIEVPIEKLKPGVNNLQIDVMNTGWFTLDSIDFRIIHID